MVNSPIEKSEEISLPTGLNVLFSPEKARLIAQNEGIESVIEYVEYVVNNNTLLSGQKDIIIAQKETVITEKEILIAEKEAHIAKLERMIFGQKSEKFIHEPEQQLKLDFGTQLTAAEIEKIQEIINKKRQEVKKKQETQVKPGKRIALPAHLKILETIIEPEGDLSQMVFVKNETSDFLEYQPAQHFIRRVIRPVYAPKAKEGSFLVAAMPDFVFEKSKVAVSMVAHLLYGKFVLHLPIDRMLKELIRAKIPTNSATIYNWVKLGINRLEILYAYKFNKIIHEKYLQVDETTLKVLESEKSGATHLGYFWVYHEPIAGNTVFKYEKGRAGQYPQEVLKDFSGYLQTDGYVAYTNLAKSQYITPLACWAHARRKFEEALSNHQEYAQIGLKLIQELYFVEQQARENNLDAHQRKQLRLQQALPVYNLLGKWISQSLDKTLPKSPIGKALRYSFERWDQLGNYFHDGVLEIDNNPVENAIRPVAIGRKNYLFAGTHESAQRLAVMYTFMADCKKHNVNPETWLNYVLEKIPTANIQQLEQLLPQNFSIPHGGV